MHSHQRACSRLERRPSARSPGLTERGSLAGPGPKLTTGIRESMVLLQGRRVSRRGPIDWAAQVCVWRRLSSLFQFREAPVAACTIAGPALIGLRNGTLIPHWSCFAVTAHEQLLHLAFSVSTLFDQCKARGRLHQPVGSAACPPDNRGRLEAVALANMRWHFCTLEAGSSPPTLTSDSVGCMGRCGVNYSSPPSNYIFTRP